MTVPTLFRSAVEDACTFRASADQVFTALQRWDLYGEWNPYIRRIDGKAEPGQVIRVTFAMGLGLRTTLTCRVAQCDSRTRVLSWDYQAFLPWLYTARHSFVLEALPGNQCRLVQTEAMQGLAASRLFAFYHHILKSRFQTMHVALQKRITSAAATA